MSMRSRSEMSRSAATSSRFAYGVWLESSREKVMTRLSFLIVAGLAFGTLTTPIARAQLYPTRQITLIAPWPAGGAVDALCRALGPGLADRLGKPVVIENRPGAGSVIGTAVGARAEPDGYTLVMAGSGSLAISATLYKKLPYDPTRDFAPIA